MSTNPARWWAKPIDATASSTATDALTDDGVVSAAAPGTRTSDS